MSKLQQGKNQDSSQIKHEYDKTILTFLSKTDSSYFDEEMMRINGDMS